ncbi:MAG: hypothetical protein U9R49_11780 [Bacteroidota bacterium]|nr:hypothetical protein [Bacteroidota bacterium]
MKNALKILTVILLTSSLTSCDLIKGLTDVEIDTNIEGNLDILTDEAELKSTNAHGFNASETVDVINDDLSDYADLIEDFETQSIIITVESIDSAGFAVTGVELLENTEFGISNTGAGYTWTLTQPWAIEPGFSIELDEASYGAINDILDDELPVTFSADGTCNKGNIHFVLNYDIEVTVVANPIE